MPRLLNVAGQPLTAASTSTRTLTPCTPNSMQPESPLLARLCLALASADEATAQVQAASRDEVPPSLANPEVLRAAPAVRGRRPPDLPAARGRTR